MAKNAIDDLDSQFESLQDDNIISKAEPAPTPEVHSKCLCAALDREATVVFDSSTYANETLIPTRPNSPLESKNPGCKHALRREGAIIFDTLADRIDKV